MNFNNTTDNSQFLIALAEYLKEKFPDDFEPSQPAIDGIVSWWWTQKRKRDKALEIQRALDILNSNGYQLKSQQLTYEGNKSE